jgi:hypothetical protein
MSISTDIATRYKEEHALMLSALSNLSMEHKQMNNMLTSLGRGVSEDSVSPAGMAEAAILTVTTKVKMKS